MKSPTLDHKSGTIEFPVSVHFEPGCRLLPDGGSIRLGERCRIGAGATLYGHGGLEIGDDTRIGAHTVIIPANHVFTDAERPIREQGLTRRGIRIGKHVRIGPNCVIVDGVTIGDGAQILPLSVVTRDVHPGTVVSGKPARAMATAPEVQPPAGVSS